ncbi:ABC transporter substrate-binding protein [Occultella aeris]|uniref:Trehalose-binding lipoprotein LpqY n=2 Tax=Occultella aeris TaxID=2761496 RepID=A0A7M4DFF8_9MICO|nr:Trehalose-binding lipoprotein LpqY precursor [Occultella aeris]
MENPDAVVERLPTTSAPIEFHPDVTCTLEGKPRMSSRTSRTRRGAAGLTAALALTLGACSGGSDAGGGGDAAPGEVSGDITLLTPIYEGTEGQRLLEDELLPQFYEQYPDVTVTVDYTTYGQLNEKLTTAVASGLIPDVMMMGVGWIEGFADRGILANLSEDAGYTQADLEADYAPQIVEAGMWEDSVYALPIMLDTRVGVARMDLLAEAGYDHTPTSWEELREMAIALTERDAAGTLQRTGFDIMSTDLRQGFETMFFSSGGSLFNEDFTEPTFNSPEGVETLQFLVDLVNTDGVEDIGFSSTDAEVNPLLNGRAAMGITHNSLWTQAEEAAPDVMEHLQPFTIPGEVPGMFFGGTMASVAAGSDHPQAAQALTEFLASPDAALAANEQRGNVPALTELLDSDYVQGNVMVQFAMENLDVAQREGGPPAWLEIRGDITPAIEAALLQQQTPQEALDALAAGAQAAIDR